MKILLFVFLVFAGSTFDRDFSVKEKDYIKIRQQLSDLPTEEQQQFWQKTHAKFLRKYVRKVMRENKLELYCYNCLNFYLVVDVQVDGEGRVTAAQIDYDQIECTTLDEQKEQEIEQSFLAYLKGVQFPETIRNMSFAVFMGKVSPYKC